MTLRIDKPWVSLTVEAIEVLPGQVAVYEIAVDGDTTVIGYAGGLEPFGLRSALTRELATAPGPVTFRYEFTHNYMSRYDELLMAHLAEVGELPAANASEADRVGRLNPG